MSGEASAHARAIWQAGVDAVDSRRLVRDAVTCDGQDLVVCGRRHPINRLNRLLVVGTGKAGAGMAAAIEDVLPDALLAERVVGWVNVPADCVRPLERIHLHAARPAGVNEPTAEGVDGARRILELVGDAGPDDLVLVLISGGGSALLPAPVDGITLEHKLAVTRWLMHSGATINELNCVRKRLSAVKGGDLARAAAGAGAVQSLIISDVIGDPLDVIASGPTVADTGTYWQALEVLKRHAGQSDNVPPAVWDWLNIRAAEESPDVGQSAAESGRGTVPLGASVSNHVIGNNQVAVAAATRTAESLGYEVLSLGSDNQGVAREEGAALLALCRGIQDGHGPVATPACVISGGEPVVKLAATDQPRRGGRNQELVLAALAESGERGLAGLSILSGGTDGEDGPTDAAGALVDQDLYEKAHSQEVAPEPFLEINDSYTFFDRVGGLVKTGPTHTNVMDLRVAVVTPSP